MTGQVVSSLAANATLPLEVHDTTLTHNIRKQRNDDVKKHLWIRRQTFETNMATTLSAIMLTVVGILSVLFRENDIEGDDFIYDHSISQRRLEEVHANDTAATNGFQQIHAAGTGGQHIEASSCGEILKVTSPDDPDTRCAYARTCNDGEGIFLSVVFCNNEVLSTFGWCLFLSPMLLLWLVLLFRMLGSTAEDYFSPSLEMFSLKLGLPPRFAGVSLLALGNGAPDVSASINAIVGDPHKGYRLILGSLSGAGMFIGTVVAGSIIVATDGIICRGALIRDVIVYMFAVLVVCAEAMTGSIGYRSITIFFSIYIIYVALVLAADLYHRLVCVPEMKKKIETQALNQMAEQNGKADEESKGTAAIRPASMNRGDVDITNQSYQKGGSIPQDKPVDGIPVDGNPSPSRTAKLISSFSDYRPESFRSEKPIILHGPDGILDHHEHGHARHAHHRRRQSSSGGVFSLAGQKPLGGIDEEDEYSIEDDESHGKCNEVTSWSSALRKGMWELKDYWDDILDDIFCCQDRSKLDRLLLICELPFTITRKLTVTIPTEGYYCRPLVALSLALSPIWFAVYLSSQMDFDVFIDDRLHYLYIFLVISCFLGAMMLRYAGKESLPLWALVPTALYGFVVAASWIDYIGASLVRLLEFFGAVCKIPNPVMGLTVLAWGNSIGDLTTNVTMARKGLANMGMTACFAGPCFTLLCGLGSGFAALLASDPKLTSVPVSLPPSVKVGFLSIMCNCLILIGSALIVFKRNGKITRAHAYLMFTLYGCYLATCIALQFTNIVKNSV